MVWLIFIPLLIGSMIGLAFVMMLIARVGHLPIEKSSMLNNIAQHLARGHREKAILLLEEDNHPASNLLAFTFNLSVKNQQELNDAFEYGVHEIRRRLINGTSTLAWLTIAVPIATVATWLVLPDKPSQKLLMVLASALIVEIFFWMSTLFYVRAKIAAIIFRTKDQFRFLSGLVLQDSDDNSKNLDITGLVADASDIVELSSEVEKISKIVKEKSIEKK